MVRRMNSVRWPVLTLTRPGTRVGVDILTTGRVRLRVAAGGHTQEWHEDTLEDVMLLAATLPHLDAELYGALLWELDLRGLRGPGA